LAKHNLAAESQPLDIDFVRRPFFLFFGGPSKHPGVPVKWGDRLDAFYPGGRKSIARLGERAGRNFNFNVELSDTMDSWRLVIWAEEQGKGEDLIAAIGRRYFEEGQQLANHAMLLSAVDEAGLNTSDAEAVLGGNGFRDKVMQHYRWAVEEQGISSIPVFLVSDPAGTFRTVVHGSASVQDFSRVLAKAAEAMVDDADAACM